MGKTNQWRWCDWNMIQFYNISHISCFIPLNSPFYDDSLLDLSDAITVPTHNKVKAHSFRTFGGMHRGNDPSGVQEALEATYRFQVLVLGIASVSTTAITNPRQFKKFSVAAVKASLSHSYLQLHSIRVRSVPPTIIKNPTAHPIKIQCCGTCIQCTCAYDFYWSATGSWGACSV